MEESGTTFLLVVTNWSRLLVRFAAAPLNHMKKYYVDNYLQLSLDGVKLATATPRKVVVGGVTFIRSKSGNLWRSGLVKVKR